jgi:hypothetical protein
MITWCPTCRRHTSTDVMDSREHPDRSSISIPARLFCGVCGWWHGYDETKPEVVEESAADVPAATDWAAWFREMWAAGFTGGGS